MSATSDDAGYQWAIGSDPETLYVQLPPVDSTSGGARDALRLLLRQRGFAEVSGDEEADSAAVANGCVLVRQAETSALLVVTISDRIGATRIPVPHGDPGWSERVFGAGQVVVVVTEAAIVDGAVSAERLKREADAGAVSAAIVPAGTL